MKEKTSPKLSLRPYSSTLFDNYSPSISETANDFTSHPQSGFESLNQSMELDAENNQMTEKPNVSVNESVEVNLHFKHQNQSENNNIYKKCLDPFSQAIRKAFMEIKKEDRFDEMIVLCTKLRDLNLNKKGEINYNLNEVYHSLFTNNILLLK